MTGIPATQNAVQIVGVDQIQVVSDKPVDPVGPHQMLLQVEACGICFSDTKLLHAFDSHPRKSEIVKGLSAEELAEIPSYLPGHEPVARIVAVGDQVTHFAVGDRVLVQADWKHLRTARSNGAFGYNFEGALQEYVVIDERCVISPEGEKFLLPVAEAPSAAAVGLIEPWATVEAAYALRERRGLKPGGTLLVVADAGTDVSSLDALTAHAAQLEIWLRAPADAEIAESTLQAGVQALRDVLAELAAARGPRRAGRPQVRRHRVLRCGRCRALGAGGASRPALDPERRAR